MAKKKKKSDLLPKRIAGVKVPKAVRKGRFGELLASPSGQKLILEAIMAGAAVVGAKKASKNPEVRSFAHDVAEKVRGDDGHPHKHRGHDAAPATAVLAYALGEAARSFADALRNGGRDEGQPELDLEPDWRPDASDDPPEAPTSKKKPTSSYEAGPL